MTNKIITIVGVGLLGGSYAMGLTKAGNTVYGIDISQESLDFAKESGYIKDGSTSNYIEYLKTSDIVVLCLYPNSILNWITKNAPYINKNAIVTDVCGVKLGIVDEIQTILKPYNIEFYASHPMRGKETLGVKFADSAIFNNANLILVPSETNTQKAEEIIIDLAKTIGFTTISKLSPREHDYMIGYLSQLTHAIAVSLMTASENDNLVDYSGDSFRDLTRIAKIDEHLLSELFCWNKDILCEEIDNFTNHLMKLKSYIKNEDTENMKDMFRLSTMRRTLFDKK